MYIDSTENYSIILVIRKSDNACTLLKKGIGANMKAITGGIVFLKGQLKSDLVVIFDEVIKDVVTSDEFDEKLVDKVIHLDGQYVLPGFIDVHIHGYCGSDVMDATDSALKTISKGIAKNGVTSFLPTTMTMPKDNIENALENIGAMMLQDNNIGARVLGAHLEGPFINKEKKGAQSAKNIIPIDEELLIKYKDIIKVITIAPEIDGAMEAIKKYNKDFRFSLGHTAADYHIAKQGICAGAKSVTHLFNAMTTFNHREPGVVGAALTTDCYVELISDNYHVHPAVYQIIVDTKGYNKILLVSDCIRAGGLDNGTYDLGGQQVTVDGISCTLGDGTIAGSMLDYNLAIRNFHNGTKSSLEDIFNMVSKNQATYLGIDHIAGEISPNKWADFAVLDKEFNVDYTIVGGEIVYKK